MLYHQEKGSIGRQLGLGRCSNITVDIRLTETLKMILVRNTVQALPIDTTMQSRLASEP
jgi:hypothetical protein